MKIRYPLAKDTIDRRDIGRLARWLRGKPRLTQGPLTAVFEKEWSRWLGLRHSVFCNSGSSANLLMYSALLASGRLKNKKAVVPSNGWPTSIAPALQLGFEPFMCEADGDTFGLELNHLERLLKKHRPAVVFLVHALGIPHKMKEVMALKRKYGFFLLEDACAAIGSAYRGQRVGTFGDMASFSFYFGHQASTIEGGMVSTNNRGFWNALLMLRSHGWSKDMEARDHRALVRRCGVDDFHKPFVFYDVGYNLRSTDVNAFLGLGQIKKLPGIVTRRSENHRLYSRLLGDALRIQRPVPGSTVCSIHFAALARNADQRRRIVRALVRNGIETRLYTAGNLGLHPFWYRRFGKTHFPMADRIYHCGFFLPNHPLLSRADVEFISRTVLEAL